MLTASEASFCSSPIFLWLIHLMLEDRTEATLETDAFATKVELISSPRSSTNTESFRLQGARSSFSYTDRDDRARETNRQSSHFTPICRTSRSLSLGETLVLLCMQSPCRKSLVKLFCYDPDFCLVK